MGALQGKQSVLKGVVKNGEQISSYLTERQKSLVKESWITVAKDLMGTGTCVFKHLVTRHPELSKLFKKFMTLRDDGKYDWDLDGLQRHANLVMQALEAAIDNLDDSRVLSRILNDLGRKHARYQVQEDMFDKLWDSLKYGLQQALDDKMNRETSDAWFAVFKFISRQIITGMRQQRIAANK